ncbi:glutamate racemase [Winogradskyella sp. DF17]|jgi:glutamate racemase|uniref:Glutamate racemase n=1 Tax=Winogradskyella pelagia TaxID=2819984 RepID=A0ABS3T5M4_9FLAO|nr:glutamate racemase [Winogradskyella sp. DF17]MBO3117146.1 glutamate racemase [Winogradskyella sp. DF17]
MSKDPIGIFDSGIGGTSILKEINALLPNENCVYLSDSKNAPYGNKSKSEILRLSIKNTEVLLSKQAKIIVVACNTATTNSIAYLRKSYKIPFIGIEPAIKPAALNTKSKTIGVLATKGTLSSSLFHNTSALFAKGIKVIEQVGNGIVPLIESGKLNSSEMTDLLKLYLEPMIEEHIDYLVLGCTHYPYLIPQLQELLPKEVKIIDSGRAVAKQTRTVLQQLLLLNLSGSQPSVEMFTNGNIEVLKTFSDKNFNSSYLDF